LLAGPLQSCAAPRRTALVAEQQLRQGAEQRLTAQTIQTVKATQESHAAAQHNAALRQECADCRQEARQLCCMLGACWVRAGRSLVRRPAWRLRAGEPNERTCAAERAAAPGLRARAGREQGALAPPHVQPSTKCPCVGLLLSAVGAGQRESLRAATAGHWVAKRASHHPAVSLAAVCAALCKDTHRWSSA